LSCLVLCVLLCLSSPFVLCTQNFQFLWIVLIDCPIGFP
jgi:hypothetical protein